MGLIVCTPTGRKPRLLLRIIPGSVTSPIIIRTVKEMRRHLRGKLLLLWDGLPAHRAKIVREFLKTQTHWLRTERFPAYAPELNPVEYLWSASKRKDLGNVCPDGMQALDAHIRRSVRRFQRHPDVLTGFLRVSGLFDAEVLI